MFPQKWLSTRFFAKCRELLVRGFRKKTPLSVRRCRGRAMGGTENVRSSSTFCILKKLGSFSLLITWNYCWSVGGRVGEYTFLKIYIIGYIQPTIWGINIVIEYVMPTVGG